MSIISLLMPSAAAPESWRERAVCSQVDPEMWFPEKGGSTSDAKKICLGCPVKNECLEYALTNDERFGVWGGYSERERRRIKRGGPKHPIRIQRIGTSRAALD